MLGTQGYTHTHTLRICNTYSTATKAARTRLSVALFFTAIHIGYFTAALSSAVADQQDKMSNYKYHYVHEIQSAQGYASKQQMARAPVMSYTCLALVQSKVATH
jgi:Holliday junction resolvasome RuvABC endonuclease subunit